MRPSFAHFLEKPRGLSPGFAHNNKATKAQTSKLSTRNAPVAKREAKESKSDSKKIRQIEASILVLGKSKVAMNRKAMLEVMQVAGLWTTPKGATPDVTLYASILREIDTKGTDAQFRRTERAHFTLADSK
jgi:hypothetical protein